MADVKITVKDDGPYLVSGDVDLVDGEGKTMESKKTTALCRCGLSSNKPFCDGSHSSNFDSKTRA